MHMHNPEFTGRRGLIKSPGIGGDLRRRCNKARRLAGNILLPE